MSGTINFPDGYEFRSGNLYHGDTHIANFFIRPTALYRRQGEAFPFACDMEICKASGSKTLTHIRLDDLTNNWWKNPLPGCFYVPERKNAYRAVCFIFQTLMDYAPAREVVEVSEIGWKKLPSDQMVYIAGGDIIAGNNDFPSEDIWISENIRNLHIEIEPETSVGEALRFFWEFFFFMPGITDILLTYTLLSFLSPLFQEAGLISRFPVILEGKTESKKTTLACLACSTFMRKSNPRYCVAAVSSTRAAVELRARGMQHCVLIVDDLFPDSNSPRRDKTSRLLHEFANQDAREIKSGHSLVRNKMDCGIVLTAEYFPPCSDSTRRRCLRLKLFNPVPNERLYPIQKRQSLLGNVFLEFLQRIAAHYSEIVCMITEDFQRYRIRRAEKNASAVVSERLGEIGFLLSETLNIALKMFPREDSETVLMGFHGRINNWLDWQLSSAAVPDISNVVSSIPELQKQYPDRIFLHHGCLCVTPDDLCDIIQQQLGDKTITKTSVLRVLQDKDALQKDRSNVATKKIAGRRYLFIRPQKLR